MKRAIHFTVCLCLLAVSSANAANEIRAIAPGVTNAYSVVREADGDVWYVSGQAFEAWGTGARTAADYDIALTDKSGDMFVGTMDTNIGAGYYHVVTHYQAGGAPADTDPAVWEDYGYWTGSAWTSGPDAADIDSVLADTGELQTDWKNGGRLDLLIDAIKAIVDILPCEVTTVATEDDTDSFTLTAGKAVADCYNGMVISVQDAGDSLWESRLISDWTAAKVVTADEPFGFTPASGDVVAVWNISYVPPYVFGYLPPTSTTTLDFRSSAGAAGGGTTTLNAEGDDP